MFFIQEYVKRLISLLPPVEHDFWVREMSKSQLDFQNPEGLETFNCRLLITLVNNLPGLLQSLLLRKYSDLITRFRLRNGIARIVNLSHQFTLILGIALSHGTLL